MDGWWLEKASLSPSGMLFVSNVKTKVSGAFVYGAEYLGRFVTEVKY